MVKVKKYFYVGKCYSMNRQKVKKSELYHSVSKYPPDKTSAAGDHPHDDQSRHKGPSFSFDLLPPGWHKVREPGNRVPR